MASKSEIRYKILRETGLELKKIDSNIDEAMVKRKYKDKPYSYLALKLAEEKARILSNKFPESYIIGADQICILDNKIFNKPESKKNAIDQLKLMQGKEHIQISAFCLFYNRVLISKGMDKAFLTMRKLSVDNIKNYIDKDNPLQSCGSYKYEERGYLLFSKVRGNQDTIKGLPLTILLDRLFKKKVIAYEKA